MLAFKGIQYQGKVVDEWTEPGWTGSRGDIVRALTAPITEHYQDHVEFEFGSRVTALDVHAGKLTYESDGDRPVTATLRSDHRSRWRGVAGSTGDA